MPVSDLTIAEAWAIELVRSVGPVGRRPRPARVAVAMHALTNWLARHGRTKGDRTGTSPGRAA